MPVLRGEHPSTSVFEFAKGIGTISITCEVGDSWSVFSKHDEFRLVNHLIDSLQILGHYSEIILKKVSLLDFATTIRFRSYSHKQIIMFS